MHYAECCGADQPVESNKPAQLMLVPCSLERDRSQDVHTLSHPTSIVTRLPGDTIVGLDLDNTVVL